MVIWMIIANCVVRAKQAAADDYNMGEYSLKGFLAKLSQNRFFKGLKSCQKLALKVNFSIKMICHQLFPPGFV